MVTCTMDLGKATWKDEGFHDSQAEPTVGVVCTTDKTLLNDAYLNKDDFRGLQTSFEYFPRLQNTEFTCTFSFLEPNTTYYYCAYTCVGYMYHAGPVMSFTTSGLSVK